MKYDLESILQQPANAEVTLKSTISWLKNFGVIRSRTYKSLLAMHCVNTSDILALNPLDFFILDDIKADIVAEVMAFIFRYKHLTTESKRKAELSIEYQKDKTNLLEFVSNNFDELSNISSKIDSAMRLTIELAPRVSPKVEILPIENESITVKKTRKVFEIVTPQGEIINEKFAYQTFVRFIEIIGEENINSLNISVDDNINLVSHDFISKVSSKPTKNGWYVYTSIANAEKARIVKQVCERLNLHFIVNSYTEEYN